MSTSTSNPSATPAPPLLMAHLSTDSHTSLTCPIRMIVSTGDEDNVPPALSRFDTLHLYFSESVDELLHLCVCSRSPFSAAEEPSSVVVVSNGPSENGRFVMDLDSEESEESGQEREQEGEEKEEGDFPIMGMVYPLESPSWKVEVETSVEAEAIPSTSADDENMNVSLRWKQKRPDDEPIPLSLSLAFFTMHDLSAFVNIVGLVNPSGEEQEQEEEGEEQQSSSSSSSSAVSVSVAAQKTHSFHSQRSEASVSRRLSGRAQLLLNATVPFGSWDARTIMEWLKCLYVQLPLVHDSPPSPSSPGPIRSLYRELCRRKMSGILWEYFGARGLGLRHLEQDYEQFLLAEKVHEESESEQQEQQQHLLHPLFSDSVLMGAICEGLSDLKRSPTLHFDPRPHAVLRKLVADFAKRKKNVLLWGLRLALLTESRWKWDVAEMKRKILWGILGGNGGSGGGADLGAFVRESLLEMEAFEGQMMRESGMVFYGDVVRQYSHLRGITITKTSEEDQQKTKTFGFELLSFEVWVKLQQAQKTVDLDRVMQRVSRIVSSIRAKDSTRQTLESRLEKLETRLKRMKKAKGPPAVLLQRAEKMRAEMQTAKDEKSVLEEELAQVSGQMELIRKELGELDECERIMAAGGALQPTEALVNMYISHASSPLRARMLDEILRKKLESKCADRSFSFGSKLILSKLLQAPRGIHRIFARALVDPLFRPAFYRYGFVHASFSLGGLAYHWFSNNLVRAKKVAAPDGYVELMVADVEIPVLYRPEWILEQIERLAKTLVEWNTEYHYVPFAVLPASASQSNGRNCQEFTLEVLRQLRAPQHYTQLTNFIDSLKHRLHKLGDTDLNLEGVLRFIAPSDSFFAKFRPAFDLIGMEEEEERQHVVTFRSHAALDMFADAVLGICPGVREEWPGEWALLRSWDGAFRVRNEKVRADPQMVRDTTLEPWDQRCPFNELMES